MIPSRFTGRFRSCGTVVLPVAALAILLICPISLMANTIILSVTAPPALSTLITSNSVVSTSWTQLNTYTGVTIAVLVDSAIVGQTPTADAYLTTRIGPGTTVADEIAHSQFTVPVQLPICSASSCGGMVTLFSGLSLGPGTYFLTLGPNAISTGTVGWFPALNPTVVEDTGVRVGASFLATSLPSYPPASAFAVSGVEMDFTVTGNLVSQPSGSYTFTPLAVPFPGATETIPSGINDLGTIVGTYEVLAVGTEHGFVLQEGNYTAFDPPGSTFTVAGGINVRGDIVGTYNSGHGFILQGSVFTNIDFPGAGILLTRAIGINNLGEIVGRYTKIGGGGDAFLRDGDQFISLDTPFPGGGVANAINDRGDIVGLYTGSDGKVHGFLKQGSTFTSLDFPTPGLISTDATGINNKGEIVGTYLDSARVAHGFIFAKGEYTTVDFSFSGIPDVAGTEVLGINNLSEIVGVYTRFSEPGKTPGFIGKPAALEFVYVTTSGGVSGYTIDPTTGALTAISGSPFAGTNPGAIAVDRTGKFAYVVNQVSNNVSGYTIDPTTGALTAISGSPFANVSTPLSVAVDPTGKFVYVVNGNITSHGVSGYTIDPTTGALTPISGSPFATGAAPGPIAVDPTGKFVYVANDYPNGYVVGHTINPTTGALTPISGSPFATGSGPEAIAVDPTGKFAYVADFSSGSVFGYAIDPTTGALTPISGSPFATGLIPISPVVDPTGKFVYVVNNSSNTISWYTIDPTTGALTAVSGSPFPVGSITGSMAVARPQ